MREQLPGSYKALVVRETPGGITRSVEARKLENLPDNGDSDPGKIFIIKF